MSLGRDDLAISSCSPSRQSCEQGREGEDLGNSDLPPLAIESLVAAGEGVGGETSPPSPELQTDHQVNSRGGGPGVPGPLGSTTYFRESLKTNATYANLDSDDLDFLSNHLSLSSSKNYSCAWKKFSSFCVDSGVEPFSCPPHLIVKYLRKLYNGGAKYRSVNLVRSAISKFHPGFDGVPAGRHILVTQTLKAIFRLRPPLPKYQSTYDINKVLVYIKQILGNNSLLNLRYLTLKCLFLLTFSSISRTATVRSLGASVSFNQGHVVIPILSLEKQARGQFHHEIVLKYDNFYRLLYMLYLMIFQFRIWLLFVGTSLSRNFPRTPRSAL